MPIIFPKKHNKFNTFPCYHNADLCDPWHFDPDSSCHTCVQLFCEGQFEKDFAEPEFVEGSRRVRVEIFEEASQTLVDTFTITDPDAVDAIFENFLTSFQKACDEFEAHLASDEDKAYRGTYVSWRIWNPLTKT